MPNEVCSFSKIKELVDNNTCKDFLAYLKWHDGFKCTRCRGLSGCLKQGYKFHCYNCNYVESATAHTLFHKVKFDLTKAFSIVVEINRSHKIPDSTIISTRYNIRKSTAWLFIKKIRFALKNSNTKKISELSLISYFAIRETKSDSNINDFIKNKAIVTIHLTNKLKKKTVYLKAESVGSAKNPIPIYEVQIPVDLAQF